MLLALVNDLLDLSKAEAGRMRFNLEPVCVADVFQEVADTVEPLARQNGNRLVIERPSEDVVVFADRGKFRQSLLNLAANACKFTENGIVRFSANGSPGAISRCGATSWFGIPALGSIGKGYLNCLKHSCSWTPQAPANTAAPA